jgi:hypothetical protein
MPAPQLKPFCFPAGQSGNPSGRPKRILPRIDEILKSKNLEPLHELLQVLPNLKPRDQAQVWLEILSYCHAKPKPTVEVESDPLKDVPTDELVRMVKEKLPELESA